MVRPFLAGRVHETDAGVGLGHLTAGEVAAFVVTQSRQRPRSVKRMVTALRSLFGFLHVEGLIGRPLVVPSPAGWTQTGLPKALDGDQVAALLASCDACTRSGRRDLAILTLLARLGLRAGEVAALRWMTSTGGVVRSRCGGRVTGCRCQRTSASGSSTGCMMGAPQPPRQRRCSSARRPRTGR